MTTDPDEFKDEVQRLREKAEDLPPIRRSGTDFTNRPYREDLRPSIIQHLGFIITWLEDRDQ